MNNSEPHHLLELTEEILMNASIFYVEPTTI